MDLGNLKAVDPLSRRAVDLADLVDLMSRKSVATTKWLVSLAAPVSLGSAGRCKRRASAGAGVGTQ